MRPCAGERASRESVPVGMEREPDTEPEPEPEPVVVELGAAYAAPYCMRAHFPVAAGGTGVAKGSLAAGRHAMSMCTRPRKDAKADLRGRA